MEQMFYFSGMSTENLVKLLDSFAEKWNDGNNLQTGFFIGLNKTKDELDKDGAEKSINTLTTPTTAGGPGLTIQYKNNVNLYVKALVQDESPYYEFITNLQYGITIDKLSLLRNYTFYRYNEELVHPFYISDSGYKMPSTNKIKLEGDGSPTEGINGSQFFTLEFNGLTTDNTLLYFCTTHPEMVKEFELVNTKEINQ